MFRVSAPILSIVLGLVLSGCASSRSDPRGVRRNGYCRISSHLTSGMTRRQLYALLPPAETPRAEPAALFSLDGASVTYFPHTERYRIDREFEVIAQFRLATARDYQSYQRLATRNYSSIDAMTKPIPQVASVQNMDDELLSSPEVVLRGATSTRTISGVPFGEVCIQKVLP